MIRQTISKKDRKLLKKLKDALYFGMFSKFDEEMILLITKSKWKEIKKADYICLFLCIERRKHRQIIYKIIVKFLNKIV